MIYVFNKFLCCIVFKGFGVIVFVGGLIVFVVVLN